MAEPDLPPSLQGSHRLAVAGRVRLLLRRDWEAALPVRAMLDGAPLPSWGRPVPHALQGRGAVHVLATPRGEIVAKRLSRGGVLGALLRDLYFDERRPLREAQAAEELAARGCATPRVVAARATRSAPGLWSLEVATARVPSEGDLLAVLRARGAGRELAEATGRTLRRAHDAGLRHRDLQVKNLLVPAGFFGPRAPAQRPALVILDLDRCDVGAPLDDDERIASLARFVRSLAKHGLLLRPGPVARHFARGYGARPGLSPAELLDQVGRSAARAVSLHRWLWRRAPKLGDRFGR
jgi:3-deoxy-D-manno-octulosonic acid kinase